MMILMEKAQATILITQNVGNNAKMGRKLTFSYRFSNFGDWPRVSAVHISAKYSSDLQEDGKNNQKMRFAAITGLKPVFGQRSRSILYSRDRRFSPFRAHC